MDTAKTYALIGTAGYIAPRHLRAIRETGGQLRAAIDVSDSVGIMDSYFPDARFFTEFERFDRYIDRCRRQGEKIDTVAICSPNYLHDAHVRFALRSGADAICEKPLVLNPWNIDGLAEIERDTGRRISTILQLRLHPAIKRKDCFKRRQFSPDSLGCYHRVHLAQHPGFDFWVFRAVLPRRADQQLPGFTRLHIEGDGI